MDRIALFQPFCRRLNVSFGCFVDSMTNAAGSVGAEQEQGCRFRQGRVEKGDSCRFVERWKFGLAKSGFVGKVGRVWVLFGVRREWEGGVWYYVQDSRTWEYAEEPAAGRVGRRPRGKGKRQGMEVEARCAGVSGFSGEFGGCGPVRCCGCLGTRGEAFAPSPQAPTRRVPAGSGSVGRTELWFRAPVFLFPSKVYD